MRIISCHLENFGSYKTLDFDFQNQGLTLIQGPTGSGKSTLMDAIPWILFGVTAKGGKVDEIRSWNTKGITTGTIRLSNGYTISRTRGPNDLFYSTKGPEKLRGRDLGDTQKLINSELGFTVEQYLSGAYFHEFSQTAQFFTTTPKIRRNICEQIADLSLAKKLQLSLSEKRKSTDIQFRLAEIEAHKAKSQLETFLRLSEHELHKSSMWEISHEKTMAYVQSCYEKFEAGRKKVITNQCRECGTKLAEPKEVVDNSINPHIERLSALLNEENPHNEGVKDFSKEISQCKDSAKIYEAQCVDLKNILNDYNMLGEVLDSFRGEVIVNTIKLIEQGSNDYLTKYFDAEITLNLNILDTDKLEVTIHKDGNECSFTQLSKGQRQLLKLCFGLSIMKAVQNHNGVKFEQIFLDEALDGLDENLKIKAYRLLEELALYYNSVFVIEHSGALKNMFINSFSVELKNSRSEICQS